MKKQLIVTLGILALVFSLGGPAGAVVNYADDDCANPDATIDTAIEAVRVANGYNCAGVDLVINTSLSDNAPSDIVDVEVSIRARTITIVGPDVLDINKRVQIINDMTDSKLFLISTGNMSITEGSIKAHKELKLTCSLLNCDIIVRDSDLIAALDFIDPQGGGALRIDAGRNFDSQRSTVHGGDLLEIDAATGSITLKCKPGEGGCKDPLVSSVAVELCDKTGPGGVGPPDGIPDYPCDVTFADEKELRATCIQSPGVKCNGGHKEKRFTAKTDVDITDSKITSVEHMTFTAKDGQIKASGAELSAEAIVMTAKGPINISKAIIKTTAGETKITAGSGCPALPGTCINGREADIEGINVLMTANSGNARIDVCGATITDLGPDKPTFNGDTTAPFSRVVLGFETIIDDAGECPAVPGGAVID